MLILGHAGIALGAAAVIAGPLGKTRFPRRVTNTAAENNGQSWFRQLGRYVDIRLLLIGSLLPDIIDKPLGIFLLKDSLSNGRILSHSLLFLLVLTLAAWLLYRYRRQTWLLGLSFGVFTHLACDQMWLSPDTLFWPAYGFTFEKLELTGWLGNIFPNLLTDPEVFVPEIIGAAVLVWFAADLLYHRKVGDFIKHGRAG